MPTRILAFASLLVLNLPLQADHWPQFRGPHGSGVAPDVDLPLTWNGKTGENVLWSAELLGDGIASPIVWKNRVFVANATRRDPKTPPKKHEQFLAAYEATSGKLLWNTPIDPGPWKRGHTGRPGGGYASCTPATDGERVYVLFGTSVLAAIDWEGKLAWRQELKPHNYDVEMATSPILFEKTVIVFCGMQGGSRLVAFDRNSGDIVWDKDLKDTGYGHNTPLIVDVQGTPRLILMGAGLGAAKNAIQGFDPRSGERIWWCEGRGETASAVKVGNYVFCDSGRGGPAKLLDPSGTGDVSKTHVKWETNVAQGLSSPLVVGKHIYRLFDNGVFVCLDAETGKKIYSERVPDLSSPWSSPVADAAGHIYLANAGTSVVVKAGPEFIVLATNSLGDSNHASPAIADGRLFLLGSKKLYAIGKK